MILGEPGTKRTGLDALAQRYQGVALLSIIVIGALVMFFLDALVDNSVVFHDEYVYKAAADLRLNQQQLYEKGLNEYIPNRLYVLVYGLASLAGRNYYLLAQFFNVLFWAAGIFVACQLAQELGVRGKRLAGFAALALLLPFGLYSKYFMPESMYFFLFAVATWLFFRALFEDSPAFLFGAGVATGLAYYVKPHAIFLLAGTVLFVLGAGPRLPRRLRTAFVYAAGFGAVFAAGTLLIHKPANLASLGVYDQMARGMLSNSSTFLAHAENTARDGWKVACGHLLTLLPAWSLAIAAMAASTRSLCGVSPAEREGRAHYFRVWLLVMMTLLLLVVIGFTVLAGETGRIHTRYYCFAYPFLLIALFTYRPDAHSVRAKLVMSTLAVAAGVALFALPRYSEILPISLVSDSPELGFMFVPLPMTIGMALLLLSGQLMAIWRGKAVLALAFVSMAVASHYYAREAQSHIFRGPYTDGGDALMIEQMLGADKLNSALVLSDNRDELTKFLFNISAIPFVRIQPLSSLADAVRDYPDASSYLVLTDRFDSYPGLNCEKLGRRVVRCVKR